MISPGNVVQQFSKLAFCNLCLNLHTPAWCKRNVWSYETIRFLKSKTYADSKFLFAD